jgi:hypothetical protein
VLDYHYAYEHGEEIRAVASAVAAAVKVPDRCCAATCVCIMAMVPSTAVYRFCHVSQDCGQHAVFCLLVRLCTASDMH